MKGYQIHKVGKAGQIASGRLGLPSRGEPYWRSLGKSKSIGLRVAKSGERSWLAKHDQGGIKQQEALGKDSAAFTYEQAVKAAETWFAGLDDGITDDLTVRQICERYVANQRDKKNKPKAAAAAEMTFKRELYPKPLANLRASKLRKHHFQDWIDAQEANPANLKRRLTPLQAALNLAVKQGKVGFAARQYWTKLELPKIPDNRRELFLDLTQRRALLAAATGGLRDLLEGAMLTGCRAGELTSARVNQFDARTGTMKFDGKTGPRTVPLSAPALALITRLSKSKTPLAYLFERKPGFCWTHSSWDDLVRDAAKAAKLPAGVCLYTLRHSFISEAISGGLTTLDVARMTGTSLQMIEKHYGKMISDVALERLSKVQML